jgi:hypothetical protein
MLTAAHHSPYPQPDEFNPHLKKPVFPRSILKISSHLRLVFQLSLSFRVSNQNFVRISYFSMRSARLAHLTPLDLTVLIISVKSTNHGAVRYADFSNVKALG